MNLILKPVLCLFLIVLSSFSDLSSDLRFPRPHQLPLTSRPGLKIYAKADRYILDITVAALGKDLMIVTRAANNYSIQQFEGQFAGDKINENVVRFEKGGDGKLWLRSFITKLLITPPGIDNLYSWQNDNSSLAGKVMHKFTYSVKGDTLTADITDLLHGDGDLLFLSERDRLKLGKFEPALSGILALYNEKKYSEIQSQRYYSDANGKQIKIAMSTTLMWLPETPWKLRYSDARVGYFTKNIQSENGDNEKVISRWRLEPRPEDIENYRRGRLVEPVKPIVFYVDRQAPKALIPYFIKGVDAWQKAFEKAGFKNAIMARLEPVNREEAGASAYNSYKNTIIYQDINVATSSYSTVVDPRSGEILQSHILIYKGILTKYEKRYIIEASAVDKNARKAYLDTALLGELIAQVVTHEVGHALGLPHNMEASASVTVSDLQNPKWLERNGVCPSIMDYARYNYVAQPGIRMKSKKGVIVGIGKYDCWSIEWGYKFFSDQAKPKDEHQILNDMVLTKNNYSIYKYGGEVTTSDPRSRMEDLGDDAIKASMLGINNAKYVLSQLKNWTSEPVNLGRRKELYEALIIQYERCLGHVAANVGGQYISIKDDSGNDVEYQAVPTRIQKESLAFLDKYAFQQPHWLINDSVLPFIQINASNVIDKLQSSVVNALLTDRNIANLAIVDSSDASAYSIPTLFSDLRHYVWRDIYERKAIDSYTANLQTRIVKRMLRFRPAKKSTPAFLLATSVVQAEVLKLKNDINSNMGDIPDEPTKAHLKRLLELINATQ